MMNITTKEIKLNSSSLISVKAELLRKEQELNQDRQKVKSPKSKHIKTKLKDGLCSQNPGVADRAAKDLEEKVEDANVLKNSRDILEKKAKLYDAMSKGCTPVDDENDQFLVDFTQKQSSSNRESSRPSANTVALSYTTEEAFPENDREKINEREAATLLGPLHYANVQHNEIRTHGVGFFQFSEDNKERQEQMDLLNQLRSQTEDQKVKKERLKEKRKNVMQQRLAKMRQRRGLPEPEPEEKEAEEEVGKPEVVPLTRDDTWRQAAPLTREWDKGKRTDQNKSYLERRREERPSEFAPPMELGFGQGGGVPGSAPPSRAPATAPAAHKPAAAKKTSKTKMNVDDIEKALKVLRSAADTQPSAPPTKPRSPGGVVPGTNDPAGPPTGVNVDVGEIPLPPPGPPQPPAPVSGSQGMEGSVVSSSSIQPPIGPFPADWSSLPPSTGFTSPPPPTGLNPTQHLATYLAQHMPPAIGIIDVSRPPPPLTSQGIPSDVITNCLFPHGAFLSPTSHSDCAQSQGPSGAECNETSTIDYPTQSVDPVVTTLLGSPIETAAGTGSSSSMKRHLAPQPAHYSSAPSKVNVQKVPYERVHLHQLPLTLPAPPTEDRVPRYRAQDSAHLPGSGANPRGRGRRVNRDVMHNWNRQYDQKDAQ